MMWSLFTLLTMIFFPIFCYKTWYIYLFFSCPDLLCGDIIYGNIFLKFMTSELSLDKKL